MFVSMLTLYEDRGRPLGQWRHGGLRQPVYGTLHYGQEFVKALRDSVTTCQLTQEQGCERLILYRASLLHLASGEFRVTGLEYDELTRTYTAQTWSMRALAPERPSHEDALRLIRDLVKSSGLRMATLRPLVAELEQEEGAGA